MPPKVSICVPNLNTRPYLPERFETIFNQTLQDWELIVVDNYSDDGAWEYIQELSAREPRMRISQAPRDGLYANWNNCLKLARGEYVYIATSDDTMSPDCLEKLVAALEQRPDCGLAHCCLTFINEKSQPILSGHYWDNCPPSLFLNEWNQKRHVRPAGHDTVLAFGFKTIYHSITQILVRRNLFDEIGLFKKQWGSFSDLEWQMRATLVTCTVHIPEYLATWRIHPQQASQVDRYLKAVRDGWFFEIANDIIKFSRTRGLPDQGGLPGRLRRFFWDEYVGALLSRQANWFGKLKIVYNSLRRHPEFIPCFFENRFRRRILHRGHDFEKELQRELKRLALDGLQLLKTEHFVIGSSLNEGH